MTDYLLTLRQEWDLNKNDPMSRVPLYHQLYMLLKNSILDGTLINDVQMPTEQKLVETFEVSRITAKRAMDELASEKLIARYRGKGSHVTYQYEPKPVKAPLIGMFCFGNLMRESLVVERLSEVVQNSLINIVTIFLGLAVGSKLAADQFLTPETLGILILGMIAFAIGTASGVIVAKIMNLFSKDQINPLIGAAGVSAVPMAARVVNKVGLEYNSHNHLLMLALGPNIAGVIGSAVAACVMIKFLG